jgi:hypothetical protein
MVKNALKLHVTKGGNVTEIPGGYRLSIPGIQKLTYLLAQLDDYTTYSRGKFPHRYASIGLEARVSAAALPGTWGFGVWNDPFGLNLGFTGSSLRLPALPNTAWYFNASFHNYLSFQDNKPAQGFLAQCFQSPTFDWRLIWIPWLLFFHRKLARRMLSKIIQEDSTLVSLDVTQWQKYELEWGVEGTKFSVNNKMVLASSISPKPPLGVVIWMDNQYAAFTPRGKIRYGVLDHPDPAWLEIRSLEILDQ